MLCIRLQRVGTRNTPHYRIVVAEKSAPIKGKFVAVVGHYRPDLKPKLLEANKEKTLHWINQGAQPSDTVHNLLVDLGIIKHKRQITYGKPPKVEPEAADAPTSPDAEAEVKQTADEPVADPEVTVEEISEEAEKTT